MVPPRNLPVAVSTELKSEQRVKQLSLFPSFESGWDMGYPFVVREGGVKKAAFSPDIFTIQTRQEDQ